MERMNRSAKSTQRRGTATVELALLLPLLAFLFIVSVDFARIFYHTNVVTNCARNGALYLSDPYVAATSYYTDYKQAALADGSNLDPALTADDISSSSGTDAEGHPYVEVTVTYQFNTVTSYPGVPSPFTFARTVRMRVAPESPEDTPNSGSDAG
jgi:Flp pilus assembly protein TadG